MAIQQSRRFPWKFSVTIITARRWNASVFWSNASTLRPTAVNSVEALASRLTERYNIPGFELEPLLNPLAELERTVNGGLTVSEDKLKFYFTIRDKGAVLPGRIPTSRS